MLQIHAIDLPSPDVTMRARRFCLLLSFAAASCGKLDGRDNFGRGPVRVNIVPGDVFTDVGATPLTIVVDGRGLGVPLASNPGALDAVVSTIRLRTYPELTPVDVMATIGPPTDGTLPRSIFVAPSSTLQSRWYVLSLATMPDGVEPLSDLRLYGRKLGALASRFNTGSAPVLRKVQISEKQLVFVHFSEGVSPGAASIGSFISIRDSAGDCPFVLLGDPAAPVQQPAFQCTTAWTDHAIQFDLKPGLRSASGAPLGLLHTAASSNTQVVSIDGLKVDIILSSLVVESGVRTWVPELP